MDLTNIKGKLDNKIITRYAPSPTGHLHIGHVASAIYVWGLAQLLEAKVIIRIEDHDGDRSKKIYEDSILEDLEWLGFLSNNETVEITRQSDSSVLYNFYLNKLARKKLIYPCYCSRKVIQSKQLPQSKELYYDGTCRSNLFQNSRDCSVRLRTNHELQSFWDDSRGDVSQNVGHQCGDFTLKDQKNYWTYQFSSVVNDFESSVNLIIRGLDIINSTGRQVYLRKLLEIDVEPVYFHHPLILDQQSKKKLSKKDNAKPINYFRETNYKASWVLGEAARLVGLISNHKNLSYNDLKNIFQETK